MSNETKWVEWPKHPGAYWMNYWQDAAARYTTTYVLIYALDGRRGVLWNGLHYWLRQFPKALFLPAEVPAPPVRDAVTAEPPLVDPISDQPDGGQHHEGQDDGHERGNVVEHGA